MRAWRYLTSILSEIWQLRIELNEFHRRSIEEFSLVQKSLKSLTFRAVHIGPLTLTVTGESEMSLKFKVALPPITASDVVSGELSVKIDAGEPIVIATTKDQTEVVGGQLSGRDGATVELSYVLIDDAGNRSEPSVFVGQLLDTIAPPKPGELALAVTEEVADEAPSE